MIIIGERANRQPQLVGECGPGRSIIANIEVATGSAEASDGEALYFPAALRPDVRTFRKTKDMLGVETIRGQSGPGLSVLGMSGRWERNTEEDNEKAAPDAKHVRA